MLALRALVEHRRTLVGAPQLHRVELQTAVPALDAGLVDRRADPRRRVGRAARGLVDVVQVVSFPVLN